MKMSKSDFAGTGKVYGFSLMQLVKNKANITSTIIMVILAMCALPLLTLIGGGEISIGDSMTDSVVYIQNDTPYELDTAAIQENNKEFSATEFVEADFSQEEWEDRLTSEDFFVHIYKDPEAGGYMINLAYPEGSAYGDTELSYSLESALSEAFEQARYDTLEATPEQLQIVSSSYETESVWLSEYLSQDETSWEVQYWLQLGYSIVVMMISILTVSYIIRAVVEEKASKLVELLMTSVKPMALLLGKILATMTYVLGTLVLIVASAAVSYQISSLFLDMSPITQMFASLGTSGDLRISPVTVIVVVVSIILGYLTYAILAGLLGACCSTIEDTQSAMSVPTMLCMAGYLVAIITSPMDGQGIALFTSLFPFASSFCGPVQYLLGNINLWVMILSWLIQAALIILLFWFSARIYRELIIHRGSRVKLSGMIAMAGGNQRKKSGGFGRKDV